MKSINDVMACKNSAVNQKTPTELYMDIAYEFTNYCTNDVKFKIVMSKLCQQYFNTFIDKTQRLDKNNQHRVIIYKGFMNMIGIMYSNDIFPIDIILVCFNKIINMILSDDVPYEDRDNYYGGYERLMNRVLCYFEKKTNTTKIISDFNRIKSTLQTINNNITLACEATPKPIKMFSLITHKQNIERLTLLCNIYEKN